MGMPVASAIICAHTGELASPPDSLARESAPPAEPEPAAEEPVPEETPADLVEDAPAEVQEEGN